MLKIKVQDRKIIVKGQKTTVIITNVEAIETVPDIDIGKVAEKPDILDSDSGLRSPSKIINVIAMYNIVDTSGRHRKMYIFALEDNRYIIYIYDIENRSCVGSPIIVE